MAGQRPEHRHESGRGIAQSPIRMTPATGRADRAATSWRVRGR